MNFYSWRLTMHQLVGCENDWEMAGAVKGYIECLEALVYNAVSYR